MLNSPEVLIKHVELRYNNLDQAEFNQYVLNSAEILIKKSFNSAVIIKNKLNSASIIYNKLNSAESLIKYVEFSYNKLEQAEFSQYVLNSGLII